MLKAALSVISLSHHIKPNGSLPIVGLHCQTEPNGLLPLFTAGEEDKKGKPRVPLPDATEISIDAALPTNVVYFYSKIGRMKAADSFSLLGKKSCSLVQPADITGCMSTSS